MTSAHVFIALVCIIAVAWSATTAYLYIGTRHDLREVRADLDRNHQDHDRAIAERRTETVVLSAGQADHQDQLNALGREVDRLRRKIENHLEDRTELDWHDEVTLRLETLERAVKKGAKKSNREMNDRLAAADILLGSVNDTLSDVARRTRVLEQYLYGDDSTPSNEPPTPPIPPEYPNVLEADWTDGVVADPLLGEFAPPPQAARLMAATDEVLKGMRQ